MINLFQPSAGDQELAAIADVFSSSWLGAGCRLRQFEEAFADSIGRPASEVVSVSCCSEGLFQAVEALGLGPGDDVVVPSISFIGAAHAVRSSGARVVLCDVDPATLNPTVEDVEQAITPTTRGILILHYGGGPGAVVELAELAAARSLYLIEDSACSLGSFVEGRACGTFGDVGVWSFDSMKVVTTGDGGMVWCKNPDTASRIREGVTLGGDRSGYFRRTESKAWWEVDPPAVGRRATMNDVAAAMGLVQLRRLPSFLARRAEVTARYDSALAGLAWLQRPPPRPAEAAPIYYWVQTAPHHRDVLAVHLLEQGIYANFRYWPLHKMRLYRSDEPLPGAEQAAASTLLLPLHQGLSDTAVERVVDAVRSFVP